MFSNQVKRANILSQAKRGDPLLFRFQRQVENAQGREGIRNAVRRGEGSAVVRSVRNSEFNRGMDRAYANPCGYHIGRVGNDKVMFVSGSRNVRDWTFNVLDPILPSKYQVFSNRTTKRLEDIARRNKVDVVVGHSRGGKLVDQMNGPYEKIAVDGAMLISNGKRNTMNIYGGGYRGLGFDNVLAVRGRNNYKVNMRNPLKVHYVYRDYRGYSPSRFYRRRVVVW